MSLVVEVDQLKKSFGGFHAVNGLSFTINQGDVYGFLGQNGAGKSTTIRMLLMLIQPDAGSISIFGKQLQSNRNYAMSKIGAVIEKPDLYKYLTAIEHMKMFAALSKVKLSHTQLMQKLEWVDLADRAHSKASTFSQGMKQRLGIAIALVHDPDLIILDEPTNGLDPQGIADMRHLILRLSNEMKKTILISSHLLSEIEQMANRMLIIHKGRKMVEGSVSELLHPEQTLVTIETTDSTLTKDIISASSFQHQFKAETTAGLIQMTMPPTMIPDLIRHLTVHSIGIVSVTHKHSLEDYFIRLTQDN